MSFWPTAHVNNAVRFVIWLHKVGLQLFCCFFSFNVASKLTEIGELELVLLCMFQMSLIMGNCN